jgi:hypothetical protein
MFMEMETNFNNYLRIYMNCSDLAYMPFSERAHGFVNANYRETHKLVYNTLLMHLSPVALRAHTGVNG